MQRLDSLDILRLVASFAVVVLHVSMGTMPIDIQICLKQLARFAVPFFFLVSGYFFYHGYQKFGNDFFLKNITKLVGIFLVASIFYLPISIAKGNFRFDHQLILTGTESHLWFLPSLIFGLIYCWYMLNTIKILNLLPIVFMVAISPIILYYYSVGTRLQSYIDLEFARFFVSIAFLSVGLWLAHNRINFTAKRGLFLIVIAFTILVLEIKYFSLISPSDVWGIQFLIGTIPLAIGIFFMGFSSFENSHLAALGRKYSLGIYLYHLLINMVTYRLLLKLFGRFSDIALMANPIVCFSVTLGLLIFLDHKAPKVFEILNGDFNKVLNRSN